MARIENVDLVAAEAQYHRPCYMKFCTSSRRSTGTIGRPISENVSSAMDIIYQYLDENREKCQFTLGELSNLVEDPPSNSTIKRRLTEKYGNNIVIRSKSGCTTTISLRNHQDLKDSWYENRLPEEESERSRIVRTAAAIVCEDIQTKVYKTNHHPSADKFSESAEDDVPNTLKLFLNEVILINKTNSCDVYRKQCIAFAHWIIAAMRPQTFASSLQLGLSAYLRSQNCSNNLTQVLSALGCCASNSEIETFQSSELHLDEDTLKGFLQFVANNPDVNGGIQDEGGNLLDKIADANFENLSSPGPSTKKKRRMLNDK